VGIGNNKDFVSVFNTDKGVLKEYFVILQGKGEKKRFYGFYSGDPSRAILKKGLYFMGLSLVRRKQSQDWRQEKQEDLREANNKLDYRSYWWLK